jgi:PAS domain S-box-containing protein
VIILVVVTTLVASTISMMVHRDRIYVSDLAQQSLLAKRNAEDADHARDRLETLLRAATGSAIIGVDPVGTVSFFSAGAELMLGYSASEVVGIRSIADFIDPAQISQRRQTIDAMRKALDPAYPERVAEVPWTARRKNGQFRRCVVRVSTLPSPIGADATTGSVASQWRLRRGGHRRDRARRAGRRARAPLRNPKGSDPVPH